MASCVFLSATAPQASSSRSNGPWSSAMKILVVHNYYGAAAPSGENQAVEAELALLRKRGHEVDKYVRHSDEIRAKGVRGTLQGALATPWNPWAAARVRRAVEEFRPDVVHVHNTFPLLSPAIFQAIGNRAARVLTLHNYRLFCSAATLMRAGHVCTECLDRRSVRPAVRYGCYRNSRLATLPLAVSVALHRKMHTWTRHVDGFIALTEFQRDRMVAAGLPADRVHVKPNFFPGRPEPIAWAERGNYVIYVGRLSSEKGIETLLRGWISWGNQAPELRVLGDGPLRNTLERMVDASAMTTKIRFLGQVSHDDAVRQIAQARLLVVPSLCIEGFPMTVCEAFAFGTPVAASDLGPLPWVVRKGMNGIVFSAGDPQALAREVQSVWNSPSALQNMSAQARLAYEHLYTEDASYNLLNAIYVKAIAEKASG